MNAINRYNSKERKHYLLGTHYSFRLHPQLLYVGKLDKFAGWSDTAHHHEFAEVMFVSSGCGTVCVNGEKRDVKAGDLLVYNAGVEHEEKSDMIDPMEMVFFAMDKVNITDMEPNCLLPPDYDFLIPTGDMEETFRRHMNMMVVEMRDKEQLYHEVAQNLSRTVVMFLFRLLNRQGQVLQTNRAYKNALEYIDRHFLEDITLEDVAQACYVNKYYLAHLFAKEMEMPLGRYVIRRRVDEAAHLLQNTGYSVRVVAERCGFHDFSYFCRTFKKHTGKTPTQFRNKSGGKG